ncbi:hypothetical protein EVAR_162_1 [Eumeta japonica]|uniref:Uncharacterized protein n=1 Tax=Eumeta variegata TaxID=151549 RepID=A0A4C1S8T6_EUMVA|nr:hypothetical protein EVAR_162_1 [Eumeta japonica]
MKIGSTQWRCDRCEICVECLGKIDVETAVLDLKEDVVTKVERSMLRWFGRLGRMNESRLTKQIYRANNGRGRSRGARCFVADYGATGSGFSLTELTAHRHAARAQPGSIHGGNPTPCCAKQNTCTLVLLVCSFSFIHLHIHVYITTIRIIYGNYDYWNRLRQSTEIGFKSRRTIVVTQVSGPAGCFFDRLATRSNILLLRALLVKVLTATGKLTRALHL